MALKTLTITNFGERTGYDYEITNPNQGNLIKTIKGLPLLGSALPQKTDSNFVSFRPILPIYKGDLWNMSNFGDDIVNVAFSKTYSHRIYVVSSQGTSGSGYVRSVELNTVTDVYQLNSGTDKHLVETGNNIVAFISSNQSQIKWKYETNLGGTVNTSPVTLSVPGPTVLFFWRNYWYVASRQDNRIQVLSPDLSSSVGILYLPSTEGVHSLININDAFLGIVVSNVNSVFSLPTKLYLWDGNWLNIYFHRLTFSKTIRGSVFHNGTTYLFLGDANNTDVYSISVSGVKFIKRLNFVSIPIGAYDTGPSLHPLLPINGRNFITLPNSSFTLQDSLYYGEVLLWFPEEDVFGAIDSQTLLVNPSTSTPFYFCYSNPASNVVYSFYRDSTANTMKYVGFEVSVYGFPVTGTLIDGARLPFYVETNWFNLRNSDYVKILALEVYADNVTSNKYFYTQIAYRDEKKSGREIRYFVPDTVTKSGFQRFENLGILATTFKLQFFQNSLFSNQEPFVLRKVVVYYDDEV
jgi:hypothetical protein